MYLPRRPGAIARSLLVASCIGLAGIAAPVTALAGTDPITGTEAVVANTDGDSVRIRSGASLDADPVTKVPEGTPLTIIEGPVDGDAGTDWYRVDAQGVTGYIAADFVATEADGATGLPEEVTRVPDGATGSAVTTDRIHLRSGPSLAYAAIDTIPAGDALTLTGDSIDGWLRVTWNGVQGWVDGSYIERAGDTSSPPPAPPVEETPPSPPAEQPPAPAPPETSEGATGTRYATDNVNLRTEPAFDSTIARVIPAGTAIELTGKTRNGFVEGTVDGDTGWFSPDFLSETPGASPDAEARPPAESTTPPAATERAESVAPEPVPAGSTIAWPMEGGEWSVLQGYNGSSHQNRDSLWQYQYSFDLVRTDGATAGQPTYSPVNGTVRWLDPSTGGISIDAGNGMAVALFHIDIDPSVTEGDTLTQGQYIGTVSPPGGGGNGGTPHIHITAWATDDGGNWSRQAIPFAGVAAIEGREFPNDGSRLEWTGTIITP